MNALLQKFHALPRAFKWLFALAAFIVAYFAIIEPVLSIGQRWRERASTLQTALARDTELASIEGDGHAIEQGQAVFGNPHMPGVSETTPESLYRLVNSILEAHLVTESSVSERSVPLTGDAAAALNSGSVTRLILEVTFEADSATVISILSELERSKEVASVSRVKLDKSAIRSGPGGDDSSDLVRATLAPEAWVSAKGGTAQ